MNSTNRAKNQQELWNHVSHWRPYHHLADLPDEICAVLVPITIANKGGGWWAIQAGSKLRKLAAMSCDEITVLFRSQPEFFKINAAPNGVEI